jgi:putative endonuclease
VTNRLSRRTSEHREKTGAGFASRYQCKKLIYYEHYRDIRDTIARESQLKKWSRGKNIELINRLNPRCDDLGADGCKTGKSRDFSTAPSAPLEMTLQHG